MSLSRVPKRVSFGSDTFQYFYKRFTLINKKSPNFLILQTKVPFRNSRPEVFCKKDGLRNFSKFARKHLCQSLFFNKVAGQACNFFKKETLATVFPVNFVKFLRTPYFTEHLW